jgi:outer membrane protein assembly factor BamB
MTTSPLLRALALLSVSAAALAGDSDAGHWPQWRGPGGDGVAPCAVPTEWSAEHNLRWRADVPGRGFSSPVIWGDRIFLTTAVATGEGAPAREAEDEGGAGERGGSDGRGRPGDRDRAQDRGQGRGRGSRRGGGFAPAPVSEQSFEVFCFARTSGEVLWRSVACVRTPHEGFHGQYGSFASASAVTDGEHVFVSFGSQGVYCYTVEGERVWEFDPQVKMRMRHQFGEGSAPVLVDDLLVIKFDQEVGSFIVAVDRRSGEERWRIERDEVSSWSPPVPIGRGEDRQVVVSATNKTRSYALSTGKVVWECGGLGANAIPTPVLFENSVLVMSGYRNPALMAIELGSEGDLTDSDAVLWSTARGLSYTASPVLHDGRIYAAMDRGFLSCFDAKTGEAHYTQERLPRGSSLKASPVAAGEHLYVATESGDVHVLALGDSFELVRTNSLGDQFFVASPAVALGELFLRSREALFCVAEGAEPDSEDQGEREG